MSIYRFDKRKWLHTSKGKKQKIPHTNYYGCRRCQLLYSHLPYHSASQRHNIKDRRMKEDAGMKDAGTIKMQEGRHKKTSLEEYSPLSLFVRFAFERMLEIEHKHYILTPLLWPSRCVLFSWCWGPLHQGFRGPLGRMWPSLPHLVSSCLEVCWQLLRGFSECPLGQVWPSLPHLVCLDLSRQLLWDPNSTELNNNSTPTQSPTGSLNRMFNRHQAEITVMQFRGYSLPVHDCNGRMGPWPYPIS